MSLLLHNIYFVESLCLMKYLNLKISPTFGGGGSVKLIGGGRKTW